MLCYFMLCYAQLELNSVLFYKPNSVIFFTICWNQNIIISVFRGWFLKGCGKFSSLIFCVSENDWQLHELYQFS